MATITGFNAHIPSLHIFNASHPMLSSYTSTVSTLSKKHPLKHSPRVSNSQAAHVREKTWISGKYNSKRQGKMILCSMNKLAETESIPLEENPRHVAEKLPSASGVYAMHDKNGELQFIGISRMISNSVLSHIRDVPELCGSVKVVVINDLGSTSLIDAWKIWMDEYIMGLGRVPFGNEASNTAWRKKELLVKVDLRLKHDRFADFTLPLRQAIEKLIKENDVLAFIKGSRTMPLCLLSSRVLAIFDEQMVNYETIDVLDDVHNLGLGRALKAYTGYPLFPQIFVHGKFIGGVNDLDEMAEKGDLYKIFKMQRMLI